MTGIWFLVLTQCQTSSEGRTNIKHIGIPWIIKVIQLMKTVHKSKLHSYYFMCKSRWLVHKSQKNITIILTYCDVESKSRIIWRPLLCNGHNKNAYFSGNEHISRRYLGNIEWKHVPTATNTLQQDVCYSVQKALFKKVDFDSQQLVSR
jgi:hypothetical protein